jgi:hypothetical protein
MLISAFMVFVLPLLITTIILAGQARWAWMRTIDNILRGMKLDEVQKRVKQAQGHRTIAKRHAVGVATVLLFGMIMAYLLPYGDWAELPGFVLIWTYVLLIPHLLALYLYHLRWNPGTLERKRKLDAEDVVYEGDYSLKADVQYGINEEGELIELAAAEAEKRLQEQS